jgi:hypothetical protein
MLVWLNAWRCGLARSSKHLGPGSPDTIDEVTSPEPGLQQAGLASQAGGRREPIRPIYSRGRGFFSTKQRPHAADAGMVRRRQLGGAARGEMSEA